MQMRNPLPTPEEQHLDASSAITTAIRSIPGAATQPAQVIEAGISLQLEDLHQRAGEAYA